MKDKGAEDSRIIFSLDGMKYPLDILELTNREIDTACEYAKVDGFLPLADKMQKGNTRAICALLSIAIKRSGGEPDFEKLMDLKMGAIQVVDDDDKNPTEAGETPANNGKPTMQESTE